MASWQSASGYKLCPSGQTLRLIVSTGSYSGVDFSLNGSLKYADAIGYTHYYDYGVRGGNWSVSTPGQLSAVTESCSSATLLR